MLSNLVVGPVVDQAGFAPVFLVSALLYPAAWLILAAGRAPRRRERNRMNVQRRKPRTARIGIFGVGYHVYWNQFPGLLDELMAKLDVLVAVRSHRRHVENFGMVDKAQDAYALARGSRPPTSTSSSATC
jgi:hypothetical protein